jgi:hypothetical protein
LARLPSAIGPAPARHGAASRRRETVLLVEDDDAVRQLAARALPACAYCRLVASVSADLVSANERHDGKARDVLARKPDSRPPADA